jgi:hypothetical protein
MPITNEYIEEITRLRAENLTLRSLLDGCTEIVELWGTTPYQITWRKDWLKKLWSSCGFSCFYYESRRNI